MAFDLKNYEPVKSRKKRFYQDYKDGRIVVKVIKLDDKQAVFTANIYKNAEDQLRETPLSTGFAQEFRGQGSKANNFSWCENCEESAIGRALDNAGYASTPSKEEMAKVNRAEEMEKVNRPPEQKVQDKINDMKERFSKKENPSSQPGFPFK